MAIPLNSGSNWSDAWAATIVSFGSTFYRTGQTNGAYNGYGTLILPFGTFNNVARVQTTQTFSDTYQGAPYADYTVTTVMYLSPQYPMALYSANNLVETANGQTSTSQTAYVIDPAMVGIAEGVARSPLASVWPNPATVNGHIRFADAHSGKTELVLLDVLGRQVRKQSVVVASAGQELDLDLAGLKTGLYSLRITTADGHVSTLPWMVE